MRRTMIFFLSVYNGYKEAQYETDRGFTVTGTQTNEAPFRYAVRRLAKSHNKIDRIIVLVTPAAENVARGATISALEMFTETVEAEFPDRNIICTVPIPDDVTATVLLQKTLEALTPIEQNDSVIIETTGGFRNAINALTLLSRFLRHIRIEVEFSTYADFFSTPKRVTDTAEIDGLFDLLDATNIFAVYADPHPLLEAIRKARIPSKAEFGIAIKGFYDVMLCCKTSRLDSAIAELKSAINDVIKPEYEPTDAIALVFRDLISKLVRTKLAFIEADDYLIPLIKWCCENGYLMQAVLFFVEKVLNDGTESDAENKKYRSIRSEIGERIGAYYWRFKKYRDDFAHADLEKSNATAEEIRRDLMGAIREVERLQSRKSRPR